MKYLYYKLWRAFKRIKTNDMPATNALIFITLWQFLNLALIYIILGYSFNIKIELNTKKEISCTRSNLTQIFVIKYKDTTKKLREILPVASDCEENERKVVKGDIEVTFYKRLGAGKEEWAFNKNAMSPEQDFDLMVACDPDFRDIILELASNDQCPKQLFFLRCIYIIIGDAVRSNYNTDKKKRIEN